MADTSTDPRSILDDAPMTARQWIAVIITIFLNALDGFDVLSSAFAGPGIRRNGTSRPTGWARCCRWN
jgi:hypothetical protein